MKNTFTKVLSFLMALTMIVGMFGAITISAAEHTHTKGEQVGEPVPATCASIGYTLYKCTTCGETYPDDIVPKASEHTGVVEVPASNATCTYPAMTAGEYCEDCGKWIEGKEAKPVEGSNPLGHKFVGTHKGTICERVNYYVCATCNLSYEDAKKADAKDKTLAALKVAYPDIEWAEYDDKYAEDKVGTGHTLSYSVKTPSTTCEDGVVVATCKICGTATEIVLKAPHKFDLAYKPCEEYVGNKCSLCGTPDPDAVVNNNTNNHTWEMNGATIKVYDKLNAALQKLGYTSETVNVPATCTENGYQIQYCTACKQYIEIELSATGHAWGAPEKIDNETTACFKGYTVQRKCSRCDAVDVLNTVSDRGHVISTTVVPATCTTEGRTVDTCLNPDCSYVKEYNFTEALGHTWGEYYDKSGSYGDHSQDYVQTRKCVICNTEDTPVVVVEKTASGTHVFDSAVTLSKATCFEKSYYIKACTIEGCTATKIVDATGADSADKVYVGDYDTTNHDPAKLVEKQAKINPTCTKEGSQAMYCTNCQKDVTVTYAKIPHVWGTIYDGGNGKLGDAGDKDFSYVAPTCTKTGKTEGVVCTLCGTTKVAQQIIPVDPTNHKDGNGATVTGTVLNSAGANCQNGGWTKTYYKCCDKTITTYAAVATNPNNHVNVTVYSAKEATCEEDGNHLYIICKDCGALEIKQTYGDETCDCGTTHNSSLLSYVIPATGHQGTLTHYLAVPETCTANGHTAYDQYSVCGCKIGYRDILAHGNAYVAKVTEKEATCTTDGIDIIEAGVTSVYDCTKCHTLYNIVDALGHDHVPETQNAGSGDCTMPTYDLNTCSRCGDVYADNYVAAKYTAHRYDVIKHTFSEKNGKIQLDGVYVKFNNVTNTWNECLEAEATPACEAPTYTYQLCVNAGCTHQEIDKTTYKAPVTHYSTELNGEKIEISWSCKDIEKYLNMTCDLCGKKVLAADVEHNAQIAEKAATCTEDGYYLYVCVDCGAYLDVNGNVADDTDDDPANNSVSVVYPALGHNPYDINGDGKADYATTGNIIANSIYAVNNSVDYVVKAQDATAYADGFIEYMCKRCGEIVTVVIPARTGFELHITTDDVVTNNGTFTVDVAISANNFKFNTLTFGLAYDLSSVKFEGASLTYAGFEAADGVTLIAKENIISGLGVVLVNVYVPNGVNGLAKNAVITADKAAFATLTFSVLPTATRDEYAPGKYMPTIYEAGISEAKTVDEKGKLVELDVDDDRNYNSDVDYDAFILNYVGDVNNDGRIDAGDSVAIMTLMYNNEYSVAADINGDGVVDLADHVAVLQLTVSIPNMINYLEMMGISIESIVADYSLKFDLDNDKDIDDTDKAILAAAVKAEFERVAMFVYVDEMADLLSENGCTTLEQLVDGAAYQLATTGVVSFEELY